MNKTAKILTLVLFFGLLIAFPLITLLTPKKDFSEKENRYLTTYPKFSSDAVFDKSYMKGIEDFLSDHFVARTGWKSLKTDMDLASGKKEVDKIFVLNDRLIERFQNPDFNNVDKNINAINYFTSKTKKDIYVMIAPTAAGIYQDKLPKNSNVYNQKAFIDYVYNNLNQERTISLDAYNPLLSTKEEYIYYRNDHHWTSLGAYYAYSSTIKKMGFSPISLNSFDIEHASNDFRGTLYSRTLYDNINADTLDFYHYKQGSKVQSVTVKTGFETKNYSSMYFKDFLKKKDKYSSFLGTNQPEVTINTNAPGGKKLLVLKDSYAHCYAPFLAQHYSQIKMVDLRYTTKPLDEQVNLNDYDQVLFLYNAMTFSTDTSIQKLNLIK